MLELTGCDGVMIGRAALGNPWMIYRTVKYLETGELIGEPSAREKIDVCILHLDRLIALKNENIAVREMRKHAAWYLKGIRGNTLARNAVNECNTREELVTVLNNLVEEVEQEEIKIQVG
jgi:tRNA-dihydrouridine synthase